MDARVTPGSSRHRSTTWLAWRHGAHFAPLAVLTLAALVLAASRLQAGTPTMLRVVYGGVVALNVLALAMSTWSTVLGAAVALARRLGAPAGGPILAPPTGLARTAVLLPIFEEDAARVFAAARVMADALFDPAIGDVDVFVLSDSRSPAAIASENEMHARTMRSAEVGPRILYRHRPCNGGRKAGNVAEFVTRWGAAYEFMVVLDADSLMTGAAIGRLIGAMEANPRTGLIQLMCYPIGRRSLFARLQQFNSRLYGPLFQRGVAFWQGPRGNFWGHNAILRTAAFAASCGLPRLPGRPPFGGEILSHDTVEAALMLRAGHDVWMLPDDPGQGHVGSWEETPTNLVDHLVRDRRWCRGNLQHLAVLPAEGLRPASRYHLVRGLLHYLYAPLVAAWIVLYAALDGGSRPDALVWLVATMIVAPRLLCLVAAFADRTTSQGFGGRGVLVMGALIDQIVVALTYPVTLVFHLVFLAETLFGTETRWDASRRDDRDFGWREATRRMALPIGAALAALALLAPIAAWPVALLAPGLLAAIPLAVAGGRCQTSPRLLGTPEDEWSRPLRADVAALEVELGKSRISASPAPPPALPKEAALAMPAQMLRPRRVESDA